MTHHLSLEVNRCEGILVRVLGLTERRGWSPVSFSSDPGPYGTLTLSLTVFGERPIELLIRQLEKLLDVLYIELGMTRREELRPALEVVL